jgi:mono/diheme cytochrome c family protein
MKNLALLAVVLTVVLSAAYVGLTFYDDHFKFGRMWETPGIRPHEEPIPVMTSGIVPFTGGDAIHFATSVEDLHSPLDPADPKNITLGREAYFTFCAQCHGKKHDGNGTVGQSFAPLPTDLRAAKVQSRSVGSLFKEISFGTPDGRQPPLATTIDVPDRWRIVAYIKSLGSR